MFLSSTGWKIPALSIDIPDQRDDVEGCVMRRDSEGEYHEMGRVPANIGFMAAL